MKTSLFTFPGKEKTFMHLIDDAKAYGFDAIELYNSGEFKTPDVDAAYKIAEYAKKQGIAISCFSVGANLSHEDNSEEIERLKKYVDVAKAAGSPFLHHTLIPSLNHKIEAIPFDHILKRVVKAVYEICDYAAEREVMCLNEDQGFYMNGTECFEEFLYSVNHKNLGLVADLGNILYAGEHPEKFVGRLTPFIKHVHVKDYLFKPGSGQYPGDEWKLTRDGDFLLNTIIGYGVINFEKVFRILISSGYEGYYSIECGGNEATEHRLKIELRNMQLYYENALKTTFIR